jgi:quinol---cytochrome c reductase iron-sulfur subunit, bacillus type
MPPPDVTPTEPGRRRALAVLVNTTVALIGGALSALLGVFAVRPARGADRDRWVRAGTLAELTANVPVPRVLAVPRDDGWYRERARETVFLVWNGARDVRVFSATCTHLGCQVLWDAESKRFKCPCHGGVYAPTGEVLDGPPPRPLDKIEAKIEGADDIVLVRV